MNSVKYYITKSLAIILGIGMITNISFSQSKKKQIKSLTFKIDSINQLISSERVYQKNILNALEINLSDTNLKIDSLVTEIKINEKKADFQQKKIEKIDFEIKKNNVEYENLKVKLSSITQNEESKISEVIIGKQIWMKDNLNVITFSNGDPIQQANSIKDWQYFSNEGIPAWCYFNNDQKNCEKYGKLYNWYAVNDPRGLAPKGWHISSKIEWERMNKLLGEGSEWVSGWKIRSENGWSSCNGNNSTGFSAMPGGKFNEKDNFVNYFDETNTLGSYGYWWTNTESSTSDAYFIELNGGCMDGGAIVIDKGSKYQGMSVRCVKDNVKFQSKKETIRTRN